MSLSNSIFLICGLPNAGKTTFSKQFKTVLHYDDISHLPKKERDHIILTTDAECVEGVFNTRANRTWITRNVPHDHKVCIWIDTPVDECIRREKRFRSEFFIQILNKHFEPPTLDEGWDEIIHIKGDNNGNQNQIGQC